METLKKVFTIIFLVLILIVAIKVVPIYYRAYALRGICKENADVYHKYRNRGGKDIIIQQIEEGLSRIGIPPEQREISATVTDEAVFVDIYYEDTADFFGKYYKDFEFEYRCEGVLSSALE